MTARGHLYRVNRRRSTATGQLKDVQPAAEPVADVDQPTLVHDQVVQLDAALAGRRLRHEVRDLTRGRGVRHVQHPDAAVEVGQVDQVRITEGAGPHLVD